MVVQIQKFQKLMCDSSRDIIRYFSAVPSEDPVYIKIIFSMSIIANLYSLVNAIVSAAYIYSSLRSYMTPTVYIL